MSKTVEVPVEWLERLLLQAKQTLVFHDGILQQPKPHEVAALLGYISSIGYMLPDGDKAIPGNKQKLRRMNNG